MRSACGISVDPARRRCGRGLCNTPPRCGHRRLRSGARRPARRFLPACAARPGSPGCGPRGSWSRRPADRRSRGAARTRRGRTGPALRERVGRSAHRGPSGARFLPASLQRLARASGRTRVYPHGGDDDRGAGRPGRPAAASRCSTISAVPAGARPAPSRRSRRTCGEPATSTPSRARLPGSSRRVATRATFWPAASSGFA